MKLGKKLVFYHGSARLWRAALEKGRAKLQAGGSEVTDGHLEPMPGRIYLTKMRQGTSNRAGSAIGEG